MSIATVPPSITAIIITHAGGPILAECVASLRGQSQPVDAILVVVSNHLIEVDAPALQLGENVGYARAANAGVAASTGEILLLNDDTRLDSGFIAALHRAWTGGGVYQPRIRLADGTGRLDNMGLGFFPDGAVWARGRGGPDEGVPGVPGCFSGAAVLFARALWESLGGFDERLGSFCEDVDLSLRMMRRGVAITPVPDAVVDHHLGASWGRHGAEKIRLLERNRLRAAVRSMPASALLWMPVATLGRYAALAALAGAGRGPGKELEEGARTAALRGLWEGVKGIPEVWADRKRDAAGWALGEAQMVRALVRSRARWRDVSR